MSNEAIDALDQWPEIEALADPPSLDEVTKAIRAMSSGKAAGPDGIPAEVYKHGGPKLARKLTALLKLIWSKESVPQEFRDANIIHLYKRKGNRAQCDNHRGISLLATAGKILGRVILNKLTEQLAGKILPESQCGFRAGRGTADMVFTARQIQEKCREQCKDLYTVFIDLTKAFDSVSREGLWEVLRKLGCPVKFVNIIKSFHTDMKVRVLDQSSFSEPFTVTNGVKQGCVLAPTLFSILFAVMIRNAFREESAGVYLRYRTDGGIFNPRRLQAKTKTLHTVIRELLFADDCAIMAHTAEHIQQLMDCFAKAAQKFGFTISLKKTEVMYQANPLSSSKVQPSITLNNTVLNTTDKFCYLGSVLSSNVDISNDVSRRIGAASAAFGKLQTRLWNEPGVKLSTKLAVYRAVVLTTLLYGCESWTTYRHHICSLDRFHMRCLRHIARIRWQDKVTNTEVLERCEMTSVEAMIMKAQLRWAGHLVRMPDSRIPKQVFYSELEDGQRKQGRPKKRYRDCLKTSLTLADIDVQTWESSTGNRSEWRHLCAEGVTQFEKSRFEKAVEKRKRRKERVKHQVQTVQTEHICPSCGRSCAASIGLLSHMRSHRK